MKRKTRETAARSITSAILNSDLHSSEIRSLCQAILSGDPLVQEIANNMLQMMENPFLTDDGSSNSELNSLVQEVMDLIAIYEIPKEHVIDRISMYDHSLVEKFNNSKRYSLKRLLSDFLSRAPSEVWQHFVNSLEPDPYFSRMSRT